MGIALCVVSTSGRRFPGATPNVTPAIVSRSESGVTTRVSAESRGSRTTAIAHCRMSVRRVPRRAISEMCRRDRWSSMRLSKSLSAPSPMRCVDRRSRSDAVRTRIGEQCRVSRRAICRRCRARLPTSRLALVAPASETRVVCGRDSQRHTSLSLHPPARLDKCVVATSPASVKCVVTPVPLALLSCNRDRRRSRGVSRAERRRRE